ncbi:MAG: hypothetical protein ACFNTM_02690 [Cardiobacterium sp.]
MSYFKNNIGLFTLLAFETGRRLFTFHIRCLTHTPDRRRLLRLAAIDGFVYLFITFMIFGVIGGFWHFPPLLVLLLWMHFYMFTLLRDSFFEKLQKGEYDNYLDEVNRYDVPLPYERKQEKP